LVVIAEMKGFEEVKLARRAAIRAVQLMDAGAMADEEVDLCRMLFGETSAEERLAPFGLLDDGGLCNEIVDQVAADVVIRFEAQAPVEALAGRISDRLLELQRQRAEKAERGEVDLPKGMVRKVPAPGREDVAERNARTSRNANARLLAVHLAQRAIYEGMARGFAELVRRQVSGRYGKGRPDEVERARDAVDVGLFTLGHGPLAMGETHVAAADVAISRMRKEHLAGASRNLGAFTIRPEEPTAKDYADDLAAVGIAAE
jgi:hypothetical protein